MRTSNSFTVILHDQLQTYPLLEPADLIKLAYQNEFGAEHMVSDFEKTLYSLKQEWKAAPVSSSKIEPIGNEICRFWLSSREDIPDASLLLTRMFFTLAQTRRGTEQGMKEKLQMLQTLPVSGISEAVDAYLQKPMESVHHSPAFRDAYHPHYRIVEQKGADTFEFLLEVQKKLKDKKPLVIAIDGPSASGKSSLASYIQSLFGGNIFHMDDFFKPAAARGENWKETPAGNMDLDRLIQDVLLSARNHQPVGYQAFDCQTQSLLPSESIEPADLYILEGSYSLHPKLRPYIDAAIFLQVDPELQKERLARRSPDNLDAFLTTWVPLEQNYRNICRPEEFALAVCDTSSWF